MFLVFRSFHKEKYKYLSNKKCCVNISLKILFKYCRNMSIKKLHFREYKLRFPLIQRLKNISRFSTKQNLYAHFKIIWSLWIQQYGRVDGLLSSSSNKAWSEGGYCCVNKVNAIEKERSRAEMIHVVSIYNPLH